MGRKTSKTKNVVIDGKRAQLVARLPRDDEQFMLTVYDIAGVLYEEMAARGLADEHDETADDLRLISEKRAFALLLSK